MVRASICEGHWKKVLKVRLTKWSASWGDTKALNRRTERSTAKEGSELQHGWGKSTTSYFAFFRVPYRMIVCVLAQSCPVQFSATLWALADQALLSMGFSWQEYGVGCHFLLQWIFHMQGSNLSWQANCLLLSHRLQIAFCMCVCVRVCVRVCVCVSCSVVSASLRSHGL